MDDTLKTRGIEYLNEERWLLFAAYQNIWLRACSSILYLLSDHM